VVADTPHSSTTSRGRSGFGKEVFSRQNKGEGVIGQRNESVQQRSVRLRSSVLLSTWNANSLKVCSSNIRGNAKGCHKMRGDI
jgi:hypothetical protein